jgi:hypothetical protein
MLTYLYSYFEDFLNYHINKITKKFKFKFRFEGTEFDLNRKKRLDNAMSLMDKGLFLPHLISSSLGILPHDLERQLEEAKAKKWDEKLIPIINAYQMSGKDISNKGGRPQLDDEELTDSGVAARDNSSNEGY